MHHDTEEPDEADLRDAPRRRARAADLFSPHRYRDLQVRLFERRTPAAALTPHDPWTETDEQYDPVVGDDTPTSIGQFAPIPAAREGGYGAEEYAVGWGTASAVAGTPEADAEATSILTPNAPEAALGADAAPAAPKRNIRLATLIGVPFLVFALFAAWWSPLAFAVIIYGLCIAGAVEWGRALARRGRKIPLIPIVAAILGMAVSTWYALAEGLVIALLVGCAGVVAWRLSDERIENTLADSMAAMLTLMWIPFLASFMLLLELPVDGWKRVFIVILAVVGNDTGGLLFGSLLGRHKLLPRVSPGKTWEGLAGGVFLGTLAATVAAYFMFDGAWYIGAVVGFLATLAAAVGDLAESAIKRDMNIKDMSGAIPGHGGVLDRLDSMVFAAPVAYVAFAFFLGTL
jgi:phosphatidate cytidylyltransferase